MKKKINKIILTLLFVFAFVFAFSCSNSISIDTNGIYIKTLEMDKNICKVYWNEYKGAAGYNVYFYIRNGSYGTVADVIENGTKKYVTATEGQYVCLNNGTVFVYIEAVKNGNVIATSSLRKTSVDIQFYWDTQNIKKDILGNSLELHWTESAGASIYKIYHLENDESKGISYLDVLKEGTCYESDTTSITITDLNWKRNNWFAVESYYVDENNKEYRMYGYPATYYTEVIEDPFAFDWDNVHQETEYLIVHWTKCALADHYILYWTYNSDQYTDFCDNYDNGTYKSYTITTNDGAGVKISIDDITYMHKVTDSTYNKTYYLMVVAYDKDNNKISTPDSSIKKYHTTQPDNTDTSSSSTPSLTWVSVTASSAVKNNIVINWYNKDDVEYYKIYVKVDNSSITETVDSIISGATDVKTVLTSPYYWEYSSNDKGKYAHFAVQGFNSKGKVSYSTSTSKTIKLP